jgi:hypothetical protein
MRPRRSSCAPQWPVSPTGTNAHSAAGRRTSTRLPRRGPVLCGRGPPTRSGARWWPTWLGSSRPRPARVGLQPRPARDPLSSQASGSGLLTLGRVVGPDGSCRIVWMINYASQLDELSGSSAAAIARWMRPSAKPGVAAPWRLPGRPAATPARGTAVRRRWRLDLTTSALSARHGFGQHTGASASWSGLVAWLRTRTAPAREWRLESVP